MLFNVISVISGFNDLNYVYYKSLQGSNDPWYCITCSSSLFPFSCLNNNAFSYLLIQNNNSSQCKSSCIDKSSSLLLKPSPNLSSVVDQLNNSNTLDSSDSKNLENIVHSKYFDKDEIQKLNKDAK